MHEFKLLKKTDRQRFYQLPYKCFVFPACENITEHFNRAPITLVPGFSVDEDFSEGIDKVCVSDARSHIERLVFPAFYIKEVATNERRLCNTTDRISGNMTFLSHGGDIKTIREDTVYLRHIMILNKRV